jgi:TPR repeat protein
VVEDGVYQTTGSGSQSSDDTESSLASLLRAILETKITPWAREMCNVSTLTVADALVRSYDPADGRQDLAPHYDVTTYATVIVPLNDPSEYDGGLFVQNGASADSRQGVPFSSAGDAVLHKYDVMHGVNVRSGKCRLSLVVWFGEDEHTVATKTVPWVRRDAVQGLSVHAAFLYGVNAQSGLYGIEKDVQVAKEYYTWASDKGHALAAYCLSLLLFKEAFHAKESSTEIQNQSVELLEKAAAQGLACAQHELGIAYKQGYRGLRRDVDAARSWLTLASQQGYGLSAEVLGDPSRWQVMTED